MEAGRVFTPEFRIAAAERMLNGESVSAISNDLKIKRGVLYRWREAYRKEGVDGLKRPQGRPRGSVVQPTAAKTSAAAASSQSDRHLAELERRLGQMAL